MDYRPRYPFSYTESPETPPLEVGRESIRMAVGKLDYAEPDGELTLFLRYSFPTEVWSRYRRFHEALVIVCHDIDQQSGFAQRTQSDFIHIHYPPGARDDVNLVAAPPLPLAGRGDPRSDSYSSGFISFGFTFRAPRPRLRPSVFLYAVLENYVSNRLGIDLVDRRVINL